MDGKQSLTLIFLLVAALIFGPAIMHDHRAGAQMLKPAAVTERVVDAIASLPTQQVAPPATAPLLRR